MLAGPCKAAAILICPSGMPKPNLRPLREFLMLLRNFPSPICTMSYTCLIRAGSLTSFSNSASFHSEAFHIIWASVASGTPLNKPTVSKPSAPRDINNLRVTSLMFVPLLRSIGNESTPPSPSLPEQDLGHHPLVLVIQQMAMKHRHTPDDWVGKVQNDVHEAAIGNIHSVQPRWIGQRRAVLRISQEVNLVDVERMQFGRCVDNTPMLIRTDANACHRTRIGRKFATVDVEAVRVLCKSDNEIRRRFLERLNVDGFINRRTVIDGMGVPRKWVRFDLIGPWGTRSASTISGLGSPAGPVFTHKLRRLL